MEEKKSTETVLDCGNGCCPQVRVYEDGTVDIYDLDHGRNDMVHLTAAQAKLLRSVLPE
jgi:hypothetical protein